jgi:hypothetical protein
MAAFKTYDFTALSIKLVIGTLEEFSNIVVEAIGISVGPYFAGGAIETS